MNGEDPKDPELDSTHVNLAGERPSVVREPIPPPFPLALEVMEGPLAGTVFSLTRTRTVLGRTGCDIDLPDDKLVSRKHASVEVYSSSYVLIRDLASTNGTFLNGFLVTQARVSVGDVISVGTTKLQLVHPKGA